MGVDLVRSHAHTGPRWGATLGTTLAFCLLVGGLTSCSASGTLDVRDPASYVDSLRGANDLAHGSLVVPPMATLRDFSSTLAAQSYAAVPHATYSDRELADLVARTGGTPPELAALICKLPGADRALVTSVVPQATSVSPRLPSVRSSNDLPDAFDAYRSARCMGLNPEVTTAYEASVRKAVAGDPVLALSAVGIGLLSKQHAIDPKALANATVVTERHIGINGCDESTLAESAALASLGAALTARAQQCAQSRGIALQDSETLDTLLIAGVDRPQVASILAASAEQVFEWTMVRESVLSDWPQPVGFGTLEATRDAVELLVLTDSSQPTWIRDGVGRAVDAYVAKELTANDSQAADLFFLCSVVLSRCPAGLNERVAQVVRTTDLSTLNDKDIEIARIMSAFTSSGSTLPTSCTPPLSHKLALDAPSTLAALAASDEDCLTASGLSQLEYRERAIHSAKNGDVDRAIAYSRIRKYLVPVAPDKGFQQEMVEIWTTLTNKAHQVDTDKFLERGRPLNLELTRARYADAIQ